MKKTFMVLLAALVIVTGASAAGMDDIDLTLNAASNNLSFGVDSHDGNTSFSYNIIVETQLNMHFNGEHGFFAGLEFDAKKSEMGLRGGYAFKKALRNDVDMVFDLGMELGFGFRTGMPGTMAFVSDLNFNWNLSRSMYLQFGLGWNAEFFEFRKNDTKAYFESELIVPTLGFGVRF